MQIKPLYKYARTDGGTTITPVQPDVAYAQLYRLVAEDGGEITNGEITNGEITTTCIDVESYDGWHDVDDEITDTEALQIITGGAT